MGENEVPIPNRKGGDRKYNHYLRTPTVVGLYFFLILRLDFESRGHAKGKTRNAVVRGAVRVHNAEVVTAGVIRRPLPPKGRRTRGRMLVLHLRVSRRIIGVLRLLVLFVLVCVASGAENLKLGQKRKIVDGACYICGHV